MQATRRDWERFLRKQRLLVVAPHADDEVAGAGGLIARTKDAGGKVFVMVVSTGDLDHFDGRRGHTHGTTRDRELAAAMRLLRVDDYEILFRNSDQHLRMDALPRRDLVNWIERKGRLATEKTRPTMIVLPAPSFNQDHEAVHQAGITACRPHLATLKSFQRMVLVADAPQLAWGTVRFHPNFYVEITKFLPKKLAAFRCHRSQIRPSPHQGGVDALEYLARMRGREISVEAAEAFECLRFVV
ncbi:MAG: PIG-L deacetylase family protein [Planctomycetota bacterium]